jgi:PhnB protein
MFNPRRGYPGVVPYVRYTDPASAAGWLINVLRAREAVRMTLPDGRVGHIELTLGRAVIALGLLSDPSEATIPTRQTLSAMTLVFVADVDAALERALSSGGELIDLAADQPWGLRQAIVADPGGHHWELSQHLRDVSLADWGAENISELPG